MTKTRVDQVFRKMLEKIFGHKQGSWKAKSNGLAALGWGTGKGGSRGTEPFLRTGGGGGKRRV